MVQLEDMNRYMEDLISNFLYYDRKEDDELRVGDIEKSIANGNFTKDDLVKLFDKHLTEGLTINV